MPLLIRGHKELNDLARAIPSFFHDVLDRVSCDSSLHPKVHLEIHLQIHKYLSGLLEFEICAWCKTRADV